MQLASAGTFTSTQASDEQEGLGAGCAINSDAGFCLDIRIHLLRTTAMKLYELLILLLGLTVFSAAVTGIVTAFSASILLGILCLVVAPASLVLGVCVWFGNNWAPKVAEWLNLPV